MEIRFAFSPAALRAARESRGKSREQLAIDIGRSYNAIVQYETVRTPPTPVLLAIVNALDVPIESMFKDAAAVAS